MKPNPTDTLCTQCGLCCDGSLFADVELANTDEASALEVMGLAIEDGEGDEEELLLQPCRALRGKRCSIYAHRPDCCRTFECKLLQEVKRGMLGVEVAQKRIAQVLARIGHIKELLVRLGSKVEELPLKERCAEALEIPAAASASPATNRTQAELFTAMKAVEQLIRETFLSR